MKTLIVCVLGTLALIWSAPLMQAVSVSVASPAHLVNTGNLEHNQSHATLAMQDNGETLIVWDSGLYDPNWTGKVARQEICARLFNDAGPVGEVFRLTAPTDGTQLTPDVSSDGWSRYIVVWCVGSLAGQYDVFCKILGPDGSVIVNDFKINDVPSARECFPAVAMNATGDFVVVWSSFSATGQDTLMRIYDPNATPVMAPYKANTSVNSTDRYALPEVDLNDQGNAIVAWSYGPDANRRSVMYRTLHIYYPATIRQGKESYFRQAQEGEFQNRPQVSINYDGDMTATWIDEAEALGWPVSVQIAIYNRVQSIWNPPVQANAYAYDALDRATISFFPDGSCICAWDGILADKLDRNVYMRFFGPVGYTSGKEALVNTEFSRQYQKRPALSVLQIGTLQKIRVLYESGYNSEESYKDNDLLIKTYLVAP